MILIESSLLQQAMITAYHCKPVQLMYMIKWSSHLLTGLSISGDSVVHCFRQIGDGYWDLYAFKVLLFSYSFHW